MKCLYNRTISDVDFITYLKTFDMFCIIETWEVINSDTVKNLFADYIYIFCAAKKTARYGRAMGGIIVFIKQEFMEYFSEIDIACNFAIFIKCKKELFEVEKDILMAYTYLPPHGSPFYEQYEQSDILLLEDYMLTALASLSDVYMLLMGDFNCRIGNLQDFYDFKNNVPDLEEFDSIFYGSITTRVSCDHVITSSGRRLVEFCKTYGIYIINGRLGRDANNGSFTYIGPNGCSVIDYLLLSQELFDCVTEFSIETRTESTHLPITVHFCMRKQVRVPDDTATADDGKIFEKKFSRLPKDINCYLENIKNAFTTDFLDEILVKIENATIDVNEIIMCIVNTIQNAAIQKVSKVRSTSQPWFDNECKMLKTNKQLLLRRIRRNRSQENLQNYIVARNSFKIKIEEKKNAYKENKLDSLLASIDDSKSFWSKLKSLTSKSNQVNLSKLTKQEWLNHFEKLFSSDSLDDPELLRNIEVDEPDDEIEYLIFNERISDDEILHAVKHLKKGKSAGPDGILPEFFIECIDTLLPVISKLFNRLFMNGLFPTCWSHSILIPLHKKGDINNPDNYRGISLLDVFGKIYTSIINRRITFYINIYGKISDAQAGFREGYSTIDNAFILNALIQNHIMRKQSRLYVCFVDFKKAFDSVNRNKLWQVLKTNGIKGNIFRVVHSMYESVKTCVRVNGECTKYFECPVGLKQGCMLSPVIFFYFRE